MSIIHPTVMSDALPLSKPSMVIILTVFISLGLWALTMQMSRLFLPWALTPILPNSVTHGWMM